MFGNFVILPIFIGFSKLKSILFSNDFFRTIFSFFFVFFLIFAALLPPHHPKPSEIDN